MKLVVETFAFAVFGLWSLSSEAVTIHRSFRSRSVGVGGGFGVSVPVDARVDKAIDEGRAQEAERTKVLIGRATSVIDGRTFRLVTDGGTLVVVQLEGVEAKPEGDAECARASVARLKKTIQGRTVRVEFRQCDRNGIVLGKAFLGKLNVNGRLSDGGEKHEKR